MTDNQKIEIVKTIREEIQRIGSANKFAVKCGVSSATISQMCNCEWGKISVSMWQKVANESGHTFSRWNIAETTNYKLMNKMLREAKEECLFIPISYRAGSGKSAGLKAWLQSESTGFIYYLECRNWGVKEFLINVLKTLGVNVSRAHKTADQLLKIVIDFFIERRIYKPQLILDQANSLRSIALGSIIHIYNALEDEMSIVICGTDSMKKTIQRGVKYDRVGYDELESRFGRKYFQLLGANINDVRLICTANGIIDKKNQMNIFKECDPVQKKIGGAFIEYVEDMRRLKRIIQREQIKLKQSI